MKLLNLDLAELDVNMFSAVNNSLSMMVWTLPGTSDPAV